MTTVIKEDKREEKFDESKLTNSIRSTMIQINDVDEELIKVVLEKVNEYIRGKGYVLTKDLRNEIIKILATEENTAIAKAYMMFVKGEIGLTERAMGSIVENRENPSACGT